MRRSDREITEFNDIIDIVSRCTRIHIGISCIDVPYVVPVSFGYEVKENKLVLYFHGAQAGRKFELLEKSPEVSVSGDICHGYKELSNGGITCLYESFMACGTAERIYGDEAQRALDILTEHCGFVPRPCPDGVLDITAVYKITAENLTAKRSK